MTKARLTKAAAADIKAILRESGKMFGPVQLERYAALIEAAIGMVAQQPARPASWERHDIADGVRSFHVEHAAGRRGAASHMLFYRTDDLGVTILRVLHQSMDAGSHVLSDE